MYMLSFRNTAGTMFILNSVFVHIHVMFILLKVGMPSPSAPSKMAEFKGAAPNNH